MNMNSDIDGLVGAYAQFVSILGSKRLSHINTLLAVSERLASALADRRQHRFSQAI